MTLVSNDIGKTIPQPQKRVVMDIDSQQQLQQCMKSIADKRCKSSYAVVFKHFVHKVNHAAYKQLGQLQSQAIAHEVTQEVMTQVWRKAHLYHSEKGAVSTWIYTICRNVCFDTLRKLKHKVEINIADDIWPVNEQMVSDEQIFSDHLQNKQLRNAVNTLPEPQKQVVEGVFYQELSQEQLARQLNIPLGTVKSRLRLAVSKLKQELKVNHD